MSAPLARPLADTLFLTRFRDFARAKGDAGYNPWEATVCALAQFGYPGAQCSTLEDNLEELGIPLAAFDAALDGYSDFASLADRLEALLADAPMVRS